MNRNSIILLLSLLLSAGCTRRPARVRPPEIDATSAGRVAVQKYDQNADDRLSADELRACPGIKQRMSNYDSNADSYVTADEISERIRQLQQTRVGLLNINCRITLAGRPLKGATVTFEPEAFLGEALHPASGTTDEFGMVQPVISPELLPEDQRGIAGVHLGIYKVRVTHPEKSLPPEFNSETKYGCEVEPRDQWNGIVLNLKK